jgi:hypothetical protein
MPTVFSTASRVFSVGLPLGDRERYNDSRLMPASAATAQAAMRFGHGAQRQETGGSLAGIVE